MLSSIDATMTHKLAHRSALGCRRALSCSVDLIDFASNDYLGLARNRWLQQQIINAWQELAAPLLGATGSRLLTGNSALTEEVEATIASYHGAEAGVIFNSGYTANLGLISAVVEAESVCLYDADIHASVHAGLRLCGARRFPWRHNDLNHLESRLIAHRHYSKIFVFAETIYSCDGSKAPIKELCDLCQRYGAHLIIDEAHATGIVGAFGQGGIVEEGCQEAVFARLHTFSKALGVQGAIVLGSRLLKDYLVNFSRPLIYTTALPQPILLAIREAYRLLPTLMTARSDLQELIHNFKTHAVATGLSILPSETPIQALLIPGNAHARAVAQYMATNHFDARVLLSPTVRKGTERLRLCLHAFNTHAEMAELLRVLTAALQERRPCAI